MATLLTPAARVPFAKPIVSIRRTLSPVKPPRTDHLGWLYLLAISPVISDIVETGAFPVAPREWTTEVAMGGLVLVIVHLIIRRTEMLVDETHAHIRANEQLQHANRLATVGQLAAGVAHELGSPLQVVSGRAKMIAVGESTGEDAKESGQIILDQARRMTEIIRGLLDFARRRSAARTPTRVLDLARHAHAMLEPIAHKLGVSLELVELEGDEGSTLEIDAIQIQQALTNLVMNAIQAVSAGGHVTIEVVRLRAPHPPDSSGLLRAPTSPGGADTNCACLRVIDDGPGISDEDQERVFEPFFTTKDVGEGTGLGLSVAHGLVRDNGGWITVESMLGKGARFSIVFPCPDAQAIR